MAKKKLTNEELFDIQYAGCMNLIEGIVLHVLDSITISGKWYPRDIGMETLLAKKDKLNEMCRWLKGTQWDTWVQIYAEYNHFNHRFIKRRFELIRKKSIKYVNKRIREKDKETKIQSKDKDTTK